jgi:hypothetical protein
MIVCDYRRHFEPSTHISVFVFMNYEGVYKSFRTGSLERDLQMVQLFATRYSCIVILWVNLVSSATITLYVASQRVFVVVYFVIDTVRKLSNTPAFFLQSIIDTSVGGRVILTLVLKGVKFECMKCIRLGHVGFQCWAILNTEMNLSVISKVVHFLTSWVSLSFSKRTLQYVVRR